MYDKQRAEDQRDGIIDMIEECVQIGFDNAGSYVSK
jgi:hypothetical protein